MFRVFTGCFCLIARCVQTVDFMTSLLGGDQPYHRNKRQKTEASSDVQSHEHVREPWLDQSCGSSPSSQACSLPSLTPCSSPALSPDHVLSAVQEAGAAANHYASNSSASQLPCLPFLQPCTPLHSSAAQLSLPPLECVPLSASPLQQSPTRLACSIQRSSWVA